MDRDELKGVGLVLLCSALGLLVGETVVYFTVRGHQPVAPIIVSTPLPTPTRSPSPTPEPIRV